MPAQECPCPLPTSAAPAPPFSASPWRPPSAAASRRAWCSPTPARPLHRSRSRRSEEHTSELQSLMRISYAVFCLKKKKKIPQQLDTTKLIDKKHMTEHYNNLS